jgi:aminoglycoside phosphotransferase (APT) family kinase protein
MMRVMGHPSEKVREVPTEEDFDHGRLVRFLRDRLPGVGNALEVRRIGGGHSNLTYLLSVGDREWVLRRPPLGPLLPTAHDMSREYRVLSALADENVPAPRPLLHCEDPGVIGAPFYVMERARGYVIQERLPDEIGEDPERRRRIGLAMVEALAKLQAVDWRRCGLEDFGRPEGYLERQLRRWKGQWERAKTRELPAIDRLLEWLQKHLPESGPAAIVQGDYKLDNVMFASEGEVRVVAIFDWEMATIGDPLADLGYFLAHWPRPGDPDAGAAAGITTLEGFAEREELVARYREWTGRPVRALDWYRVLALFKLAIIGAGIYSRFARGQTTDARFEGMGAGIPKIADRALNIADASGL